VEVNLAPAPDLLTFARYACAVHAAAGDAGLSAVRWRYNGQATDSGGGGQLTLGGPTPERSPFFLAPALLPRLLRYLSRHPSLSYAFAPDCAGSAGQGPRADEGVRERFDELGVALDRLASRGDHLGAAELWSALAPLLVDASGNTHRAEVNVEKLWNPFFGARGKLGLVELRALRMQPDPARMVAVAALFRAVAVRCARAPYEEPLAEHGAALHDRLSLPVHLEEDLRGVLADLAAHGFALPALLADLVLAPPQPVASVAMGAATLALTPAVEFWPLVGDVASQERSGARLVDASSARLQALVVTPPGEDPGRLSAMGWDVPLAASSDGLRHVGAVRYRAFPPRPGLHPDLDPHDPLLLAWTRAGRATSLALHGWRPSGGAYDGLPRDGEEAERRRRERVVVGETSPREPRTRPTSGLTLDLRRLPAGE